MEKTSKYVRPKSIMENSQKILSCFETIPVLVQCVKKKNIFKIFLSLDQMRSIFLSRSKLHIQYVDVCVCVWFHSCIVCPVGLWGEYRCLVGLLMCTYLLNSTCVNYLAPVWLALPGSWEPPWFISELFTNPEGAKAHRTWSCLSKDI